MLPVKLSNIPRTDLERRGKDRGPHVYPFHDPQLTSKYAKLVLPSQDQATKGGTTHPALQKTWFNVQVTHFNNARPAPIPRWPFGKTTVEQPQDGSLPSDGGRLDIQDLGGVQATLEEAGEGAGTTLCPTSAGPNPTPKSSKSKTRAFPSVLAPEVSNIRCRSYKLKVQADLQNVLREWNEAFMLTKNAAVDRVNKIQDSKDLSKFGLISELVNKDSEFYRQHSILEGCPAVLRRSAVSEAVAARKAALTKHKKGGKLNDIKKIENVSSFCLTFNKNMGRIVMDRTIDPVRSDRPVGLAMPRAAVMATGVGDTWWEHRNPLTSDRRLYFTLHYPVG